MKEQANNGEESTKVTKKIITGILLGTAIGTVTGVLTAPKSGKETREYIVVKSKKTIVSGKKKTKKIKKAIGRACADKKEVIGDFVERFR